MKQREAAGSVGNGAGLSLSTTFTSSEVIHIPRLFKSVSITENETIAVADDGTAWWLSADGTTWTQLPPLPARELPTEPAF